MINDLTYEQIIEVAETIKKEKDTITNCTRGINLEELNDFLSIIDLYSKYLNTLVQLNKDADNAIKNMV